MSGPACLGIVIPCYNESAVVGETGSRVAQLLQNLIDQGGIAEESFACLVDDGSSDDTWAKIEALHSKTPRLRGLKLSRNQGHQVALWAGYKYASTRADVCISMDADLQDDPECVKLFMAEFSKGNEVVYGVRKDRSTDSWGKRVTALGFYRFMAWMGCEVVHNHADYRLLSRRALQSLLEFNEANLFIRGLVPLVGFKSSQVFYARGERFSGETKYPLRKMIAFALDGITSFSVTPLRWVTLTGGVVFGVSLLLSAWALLAGLGLLPGSTVPGWTSTVLPVYFLGGIQILCIGLIGEYLAKIYQEIKRRPKYFVEKELS